jgi:hypothetical protein
MFEQWVHLNIGNHTVYFENFWKITGTVMWENHKPFVSHRVQFGCTICLVVMRLLFIL